MSMSNLLKQLEELNVLRYSLLPGEVLSLVLPPDELTEWEALMQLYSESPSAVSGSSQTPTSACRFQIKVEDAPFHIEIELPRNYPDLSADVYVRGDGIDRSEQERLLQTIKGAQKESRETYTEYPVYNLVSSTLLPLLHDKAAESRPSTSRLLETTVKEEMSRGPIYHALFTSHHLISPVKRRSLQKWSSELSLCGFAKVGYPGCIYCEGRQADVEEFVGNVKAMQWLALRHRFAEPLNAHFGRLIDVSSLHRPDRRWVELEKVGEIVELMREVGRGTFVTEIGLGTGSKF